MLVEPRPPGRGDAIAGLQDRAQARAGAATDEAEMAAMLARHQFEDSTPLPVALDAKHDAFVGPLHRGLVLREFQSHLTIALGVVAPAFAHLHEQEQMDRLLENLADIAPRLGSDGLDALAAFAQHDLALALALHIDRLLDSHGAV